MDEQSNVAVTTAEAPVTESASVEESTVDTSVEASEKTETTQEEGQDNQTVGENQVRDEDGQVIPKARLDEVIRERNELREFKAQQEAQRLEQEKLVSMTPEAQAEEAQLQKARDALKKMGFITQDEVQKQQESEKAKNMFISECNRLESKYDGKDGGPKFVAVEAAEFMDELAAKGNLITDPEIAFKLKNLDAIAQAKAKAQKSTAFSETQSGGMNEVTDARSAELEAAAETNDFRSYLKKYAGVKK